MTNDRQVAATRRRARARLLGAVALGLGVAPVTWLLSDLAPGPASEWPLPAAVAGGMALTAVILATLVIYPKCRDGRPWSLALALAGGLILMLVSVGLGVVLTVSILNLLDPWWWYE